MTRATGKFNLKGRLVEYLTVIGPGVNIGNERVWVCLCKCGNTIVKRHFHLTQKSYSHSCGCQMRRTTLHGMSHMPEYKAWIYMIHRCQTKTGLTFTRYGARGIVVCHEWRESFEAFYKYLGPKPTRAHSIDRINNDGSYEPGNVRWATKIEQMRNRSSTIMVEIDGAMLPLTEAAEKFKINSSTLYYRLMRGLSGHDALTLPLFYSPATGRQ